MQPNTTWCICMLSRLHKPRRSTAAFPFGKQAFSGRKARREKGWGIYLAPSFLLFPTGQEPSELPLTFRLHYPAPRWPLMKPDASVWLFIQDWKQRSNPADQKGERKGDPGKLKDTMLSKIIPFNLIFSMPDRQNNQSGHIETERKKINTVFSKRSSGHLSHT